MVRAEYADLPLATSYSAALTFMLVVRSALKAWPVSASTKMIRTSAAPNTCEG